MADLYDELFGHFDNYEPAGEKIYGGDPPEDFYEEDEVNPETAKEAGEAFDNMMEKPEQILDRIFKGIWTAGGKS
jgi:hypothetical protein